MCTSSFSTPDSSCASQCTKSRASSTRCSPSRGGGATPVALSGARVSFSFSFSLSFSFVVSLSFSVSKIGGSKPCSIASLISACRRAASSASRTSFRRSSRSLRSSRVMRVRNVARFLARPTLRRSGPIIMTTSAGRMHAMIG